MLFSHDLYMFQLRRAGAYQARIGVAPPWIDGDLVRDAFAANLRVFVMGDAAATLAARAHPWLEPRLFTMGDGEPLHELHPRSAAAVAD